MVVETECRVHPLRYTGRIKSYPPPGSIRAQINGNILVFSCRIRVVSGSDHAELQGVGP